MLKVIFLFSTQNIGLLVICSAYGLFACLPGLYSSFVSLPFVTLSCSVKAGNIN